MKKHKSFALYGLIFITFAIVMYIIGVLIASPLRLFAPHSEFLRHLNIQLVWYSGMPLMIGLVLFAWDFLFVVPDVRKRKTFRYDPPENPALTVVLTAYNDEISIGPSVKDFLSHPRVRRVIVISNNSQDKTMEKAIEAGALAYNEDMQGYGACVVRALKESLNHQDTSLTLLCEGDMTFRAYDIDKFLSYIPHADIGCGTRICDKLQQSKTQVTTFIHYGNFFVAKLLELKHIGKCTLSDVGTTYKLCRNDVLERLLPYLSPYVNLEFNPYFIDKALGMDLNLVECPITFHQRWGESKGGNVNNKIAFRLGMRIISGIFFRWHEHKMVSSAAPILACLP